MGNNFFGFGQKKILVKKILVKNVLVKQKIC